MSIKINRAVVIGSGVMGSQIAALLAANGVKTHLLDLTQKDAPSDPKVAALVGDRYRSLRSIMAIENLKTLRPSPLYSAKHLDSLIPGNFDDDMSVIAQADWVLEAVSEQIAIKNAIHKRIAEYARPGIPITTNTSGISIAEMAKAFPDHLVANFFGTHFFNPPRYLRLVELVPHSDTNHTLMKDLGQWIASRLGKGLVDAIDTINFIANRIGVFNFQCTLKHMQDLKLNIETVDELSGKLVGRPASATFRTLDVVGLDTFVHVTRNVYDSVPKDPYRELFKPSPWIMELIEKGALGQKSNSTGCYKKTKDEKGQTAILVYRLDQKNYVPQQVDKISWLEEASKISNLHDRLKFVLKQKDTHGQFVWRCLRDTWSYCALLVSEIGEGKVKSIDDGIRWGFNWQAGPFEMWQALGYSEILAAMKTDGTQLPPWAKDKIAFYTPSPDKPEWHITGPEYQFNTVTQRSQAIEKQPEQFNLPPFRTTSDNRVVASNGSASLVNIGHGVACLTFHSKMNAIDSDIIDMMFKTVEHVQNNFDGLVIANDADNFSAGANLKEILKSIDSKNFDTIEKMVRNFQAATQMIKFAPFPSISAPHGLTLGGGCEVALCTTSQVLCGETYAGLVEIGVGLLPAGGGTKELALRAYRTAQLGENADPMPYLQRAFKLIGMAEVSTSGHHAMEMGLMPAQAHISLGMSHQVLRAKEAVLALVKSGYIPTLPEMRIKAVGDPGIQTFKLGLYNMLKGRFISEHDALIGEKIASVLCGGPVDPGTLVSEQYLLELERQYFMELCHMEKTRARIETMLKTGKALRN